LIRISAGKARAYADTKQQDQEADHAALDRAVVALEHTRSPASMRG